MMIARAVFATLSRSTSDCKGSVLWLRPAAVTMAFLISMVQKLANLGEEVNYTRFAGMTNEAGSASARSFGFRHLEFFRHSSFVIRHSSIGDSPTPRIVLLQPLRKGVPLILRS